MKPREITVHPNSMAARKWKRTTLTSYVPAVDARPAAAPGAARRRRGRTALTTREEARTVPCSTCGAAVGDYCSRRNGKPRMQAHSMRHALAVKTGSPYTGSLKRRPTSARSSTARDKR